VLVQAVGLVPLVQLAGAGAGAGAGGAAGTTVSFGAAGNGFAAGVSSQSSARVAIIL